MKHEVNPILLEIAASVKHPLDSLLDLLQIPNCARLVAAEPVMSVLSFHLHELLVTRLALSVASLLESRILPQFCLIPLSFRPTDAPIMNPSMFFIPYGILCFQMIPKGPIDDWYYLPHLHLNSKRLG